MQWLEWASEHFGSTVCDAFLGVQWRGCNSFIVCSVIINLWCFGVSAHVSVFVCFYLCLTLFTYSSCLTAWFTNKDFSHVPESLDQINVHLTAQASNAGGHKKRNGIITLDCVLFLTHSCFRRNVFLCACRDCHFPPSPFLQVKPVCLHSFTSVQQPEIQRCTLHFA